MIHIVFTISILAFLMDVTAGAISYALYRWQKTEINKHFCACALRVSCLVAMYLVSAYGTVAGIAQSRPQSSVFFYLGNAILPPIWFSISKSLYRLLSLRWTGKKSAAYALASALPFVLCLGSGATRGTASAVLYALYSYAFDSQSLIFMFIALRALERQRDEEMRVFLKSLITIIAVCIPVFFLEDAIPAMDAFYSSLGLTWPVFILYQFALSIAALRFALASLFRANQRATPQTAPAAPAPADAPPFPAAERPAVRLLGASGLSRREIDVAALLIERRSYKEIADTLFISMPTVKSHVHHIFKKLGINSSEELRDFAEGGGSRPV